MSNEIATKQVRVHMVTGELNRHGFHSEIKTMDCVEKNYRFTDENTNRLVCFRHDLMELSDNPLNDHSFQGYTVFCFDGDKDKALQMIKEHIFRTVTAMKADIDQVYGRLMKIPENKERHNAAM